MLREGKPSARLLTVNPLRSSAIGRFRPDAYLLRCYQERSAERGIDHELVATRAEIRQLMRGRGRGASVSGKLLQGWRREFLGNELEEMAQAQ